MMKPNGAKFLSADWRYLAMLNYEVGPEVLDPFVPKGTELDQWNGRTFVSVVGFLFQDTRIGGLAIPFHRDFEEVNLRFYVRRFYDGEWRRGVVFIKEIVPRWAIAWTARTIYNENYVALPMGHDLQADEEGIIKGVGYEWKVGGRKNFIEVIAKGEARPVEGGSEEEFITEHYWGYARQRDGGTLEYRVEHPRWRVWAVASSRLECDVSALYGAGFAKYLEGPPSSAFLADGSAVTVLKGNRIA